MNIVEIIQRSVISSSLMIFSKTNNMEKPIDKHSNEIKWAYT